MSPNRVVEWNACPLPPPDMLLDPRRYQRGAPRHRTSSSRCRTSSSMRANQVRIVELETGCEEVPVALGRGDERFAGAWPDATGSMLNANRNARTPPVNRRIDP